MSNRTVVLKIGPRAFLKSSLNLPILQIPGKKFCLIKKLQSWDICCAKTLATKNLPDKLSMNLIFQIT